MINPDSLTPYLYDKCFAETKNPICCTGCDRYDECRWASMSETYRNCVYRTRKTFNPDNYCATCPNYRKCRSERGLPFKSYSKRNVVINVYPDSNYTEIVYYKDPFIYLEDSGNLDPVERQRMMRKNENGEYVPVNDDFTISALQRSIRNASKRSKDSFYGYAQANDWAYFFTLTFSPEVVNRYDDNAVKALWSDFERWCKRRSPDVKILAVPERHKDGALHFHGFMSENQSITLTPFVDEKTGKQKTCAFGSPLWNIKEWTNGFSSLAIIPPENNYARVANYVMKYISKDGNIGYNQKRFYRTRNLNFKNKSLFICDPDEIEDMAAELGLVPIKENDRIVVFRKVIDK